jgi:small ligand-binding sensory domain FIST
MPFAAALSEHPITAYAVGEVAGQVLETLGSHPDLALLFMTPPHGGALEDAAATVRATLGPSVLIGCVSESIVGPGREVEGDAAVSLWAGRFGPVLPVRINARPDAEGGAVFEGLPRQLPFAASTLLLIGDPYSMPPIELLDELAALHPGLAVVGGMASGARAPGCNRLVLDDTVQNSGAVGVLLGPGVRTEVVVSQGCRPIGAPYVVTSGSGQFIRELAGRPALTRLDDIAAALSPDDVRLINRSGLQLGRVIDEHQLDFGPGDFLIRNVLGGDRDSGAIAVDDRVELGTTVQFQVRDAASADADLRDLLAGRSADAALLFTCNGRGEPLFGLPDHDAAVIAETLDAPPCCGFFAAGELGPVGDRNFLHSFTASVVLLSDPEAGPL